MSGLVKYNLFLKFSLIIAFLVAFLYAVVPANYYEFETMAPMRDSYYTIAVTSIDCLAVIPKIIQNNIKNTFSPLRIASLRLFVFLGICNIILALSKSCFTGKVQLFPINIKKSIILRLRI
jgi:hypothetical protein